MYYLRLAFIYVYWRLLIIEALAFSNNDNYFMIIVTVAAADIF